MKIGFIGVGAMAQAIIQGLLRADFVPSKNILVHSARQIHYETYANQYGLTAQSSNLELTKNSDLIVLAVIPGTFCGFLEDINAKLIGKNVLASLQPKVKARYPLIYNCLSWSKTRASNSVWVAYSREKSVSSMINANRRRRSINGRKCLIK